MRKAVRTALVILPLAAATQIATPAAHAAPTFNAPNNTSITLPYGCSGGSTSGSLTGSVNPGGGGVSLSGTAGLTDSQFGACTMLLKWKGTGSGTMDGASYSSSFVLTPPGNGFVSAYTLTIYLNGVAQPPINCSVVLSKSANSNSKVRPHGEAPDTCSGAITVPLSNFSASGTLSTYEADLSITGTWESNSSSTMTASIPAGASIDIFATGPAAPAPAPALSSAALVATALLLALAAFRMAGWKPSRGSSGPLA